MSEREKSNALEAELRSQVQAAQAQKDKALASLKAAETARSDALAKLRAVETDLAYAKSSLEKAKKDVSALRSDNAKLRSELENSQCNIFAKPLTDQYIAANPNALKWRYGGPYAGFYSHPNGEPGDKTQFCGWGGGSGAGRNPYETTKFVLPDPSNTYTPAAECFIERGKGTKIHNAKCRPFSSWAQMSKGVKHDRWFRNETDAKNHCNVDPNCFGLVGIGTQDATAWKLLGRDPGTLKPDCDNHARCDPGWYFRDSSYSAEGKNICLSSDRGGRGHKIDGVNVKEARPKGPKHCSPAVHYVRRKMRTPSKWLCTHRDAKDKLTWTDYSSKPFESAPYFPFTHPKLKTQNKERVLEAFKASKS